MLAFLPAILSLLGSTGAGAGASGLSGLLSGGGASAGLSSLVNTGAPTGGTNMMQELMKRAAFSAAQDGGQGRSGPSMPMMDHLSMGLSEGTNKTQDMMSKGTAQEAMGLLRGLPVQQSQYRPLQTRYDNPYLKSLLGV